MNTYISPDILKSFVVIAEEGSFLRAASRVGRTQSAVTMQIQRLEKLVGHSLFTRERPFVRLTQKGEKMLGYAHRILQLQDEAWKSMSEPILKESVKFGIPDDYAIGILPKILERFSNYDTQIEVEVHCNTSTNLDRMITDNKLDLALVSRRPKGSPGEFIRKEPLVWATSKHHSVHTRSTLPLAVFQEDCLIRQSASNALGKMGRLFRIAYSSPNLAALLAVAGSGLAVAAMPSSSVPKNLKILSEEEGFPQLPEIELGLLIAPDTSSEAVKLLADCIKEI
ncbi:MAG: LysR substrate-binding domain-containing protein [Sneathiella sp.]